MKGLTVEQVKTIVDKLGIEGEDRQVTSIIACNLYELFIEKEALLLEINPFALDICGECMWKKKSVKLIFPITDVNVYFQILLWIANVLLTIARSIGRKNCLLYGMNHKWIPMNCRQRNII